MFKINSSLRSLHSVNGKVVDNRELNISSNGKQNDVSGKINGKKIKVNNIDNHNLFSIFLNKDLHTNNDLLSVLKKLKKPKKKTKRNKRNKRKKGGNTRKIR
jgi:hypothetical protein